ncbi:MAG: helix-turn-helix transcriptional regulator [Clostridia bacterium]|nr:helix-turn-helix transcriptional regulator [Clostridia bacterium]
MENLREVIPNNIIKLRKQNNLTQIDLASKINYSDKAISRWEKGEVLPDVETLQTIAEVFNVPLSQLLESGEKKQKSSKFTRADILSRIFFMLEIWTIICVAYAYLNVVYERNFWKLFLIGVPVSSFVLFLLDRRKHNISSFVCGTVFIWSLLTCIFIYLLPVVTWYVFIIGIPLQGIMIIKYIFNFRQRDVLKIKKMKVKKEKK